MNAASSAIRSVIPRGPNEVSHGCGGYWRRWAIPI